MFYLEAMKNGACNAATAVYGRYQPIPTSYKVVGSGMIALGVGTLILGGVSVNNFDGTPLYFLMGALAECFGIATLKMGRCVRQAKYDSLSSAEEYIVGDSFTPQ